MNILLISYLFPPEVNPQSILSARFAKYLQRAGHQVTVLAGSNVEKYNSSHGSDKLLLDDLKGIETLFIADKKFTGIFCDLKNKIVYHENYNYWVNNVLKAVLEQCNKSKFDVIYTLAAPLASNIAGLTIKRATGIPWVAHFSDPTMTAFNKRFKSPIRNYLTYRDEKLIFKHADAITFVNIETLEKCTEFNPIYRKKCHVIPHCFDPEYFEVNPSIETKKASKFSYVGSLYSRRNPFELIDALSKIIDNNEIDANNIELNLYGTIDAGIISKIDTKAKPWVKIRGSVSYKDSINAMQDSDCLILIDMPDSINLFTPSKLIDYIAALKPIIGLTSLDSNSAILISMMGYPVIAPHNIELLSSELSKIIKAGGLSITNAHRSLLEVYSADKVVNSLVDVFNQVIKYE